MESGAGCCGGHAGDCQRAERCVNERTRFFFFRAERGTKTDARLDGLVCVCNAAGDTIDNPIVIEELPFSTTGDSTGFTSIFNNVGDGPDVIFAYSTAEEEVLISVDTCGSEFDTLIAVYELISGAAFLQLSNDDSSFCPGDPTLSQLTIKLLAGKDYLILVVRGERLMARCAVV